MYNSVFSKPYYEMLPASYYLVVLNGNVYLQLLSGGNYDIDVDDLRNNTRYTGGYSEGSRTVKLFWEVLLHHSRLKHYLFIWFF